MPAKSSRRKMNKQIRPLAPPVAPPVSQEEIQPWHRLGGVEHICELRKDCTVLYAIFVNILREIYATDNGRTFGCPDVLWSPNPDDTGIWIDTELRWEDKRPDFSPAIFVSLGEISTQPMGTLGGGTLVGGPGRFGEYRHQIKVSGSVSFIHISTAAGEACAIADNTEKYLTMMQDQLRDAYCFTSPFRVAGRVALQKGEQTKSYGKNVYASVVSLGFTYYDAWIVKKETPILKAIDIVPPPGGETVNVAGDNVIKSNGHNEIEFGNISTSTDMPLT